MHQLSIAPSQVKSILLEFRFSPKSVMTMTLSKIRLPHPGQTSEQPNKCNRSRSFSSSVLRQPQQQVDGGLGGNVRGQRRPGAVHVAGGNTH